MFTVLWLIWIAQFFAIEGAAIFNKKSGDTLSEHMWKWFSIRDKSKGWKARRASMFFFLAWLCAHFAYAKSFFF